MFFCNKLLTQFVCCFNPISSFCILKHYLKDPTVQNRNFCNFSTGREISIRSIMVLDEFVELILSEQNLSVRLSQLRSMSLYLWPLCPGQWCRVAALGEVFSEEHTQDPGVAHSLHSSVVDGQWRVLGGGSLEVENNLLYFLHIKIMWLRLLSLHHTAIWLTSSLYCVSRVKNKKLCTHRWEALVFRMIVLDALPPTQTACSLSVRKSSNQLQNEVFSPKQSSFCISCWGMIVLKTELQSKNSILT